MSAAKILPTSTRRKTIRVRWVRPKLYRKQLEAIFCKERYGFVEASTKSGKTTGCIAWIIEEGFKLKAGQEAWWVAPVYKQARIAYRRIKRFMTRGSFIPHDGEMTITLISGGVIRFQSADDPDNLYGDDVHAVVIDEASRCKEEAFTAIRSTLTKTRGPIRAIGNVKGRKNWFYKMCRRAEGGATNMHFRRLTAYDAVDGGVLAAGEIEDAKALLPPDVFDELYLAIASDDQGNPFGLNAIRAAIVDNYSDDPIAVWGWDLAKSSDWTVGIALDHRGRVVRFERWQKVPWPDTVARISLMSGSHAALIDATGVGDPIVDELQKHGDNFVGFKFTSASKQQLMEALTLAIQSKELTFPKGVLSDELETFEYVYKRTGVRYSAPVGFHDDAVCALALAHRALKTIAAIGEPSIRSL